MRKSLIEILNYDIIENVGLGDIRFGMTHEEFLKKYNLEDDIKNGIARQVIGRDGSILEAYSIAKDSIHISFENGILDSIILSGINGRFSLEYEMLQKTNDISSLIDFKGKLNGKIGIGSRFGELRAIRRDMQYDDDTEGFYLGIGYKFEIRLEPPCEFPTWFESSFCEGKIDDWYIDTIIMKKWDKDDEYNLDWTQWCRWTEEGDCINNWVEPEEKYLKIRYR